MLLWAGFMSDTQTNMQWSCYFYISRIADSSDISSLTQNYFGLDKTIRSWWWLPRAVLKTTLFIIKTKKIVPSRRTVELETEIIDTVLGKSFVLIIVNDLWTPLRCPNCDCSPGLHLAEKFMYVFWSSCQNKANCNYAVWGYFFPFLSPSPKAKGSLGWWTSCFSFFTSQKSCNRRVRPQVSGWGEFTL